MKAYFVRTPRTIHDLLRPHVLEMEKEYVITRDVTLSHIAYKNFAMDMLIDRTFIEESDALGEENGVMKCLFVHERDHKDGILVIPEMRAFVKWAAYTANIPH